MSGDMCIAGLSVLVTLAVFWWVWGAVQAAERAWADHEELESAAVPEGWDALRRIEKERGRE